MRVAAVRVRRIVRVGVPGRLPAGRVLVVRHRALLIIAGIIGLRPQAALRI
jgi:hypothetical protein